MTHDSKARYKNNLVLKVADNTAVVGLITNGDETAYRLEVEDLTRWCGDNNFILNIQKSKEMVFCRTSTAPPPLSVGRAAVEIVPSVTYFRETPSSVASTLCH